jgi:hypothetical protein
MAYNNPTPEKSTTLTADERAIEATRLVSLLSEVDEDDLVRSLTASALGFVQDKMMEASLGGRVSATPSQLLWLRDLWSKFA